MAVVSGAKRLYLSFITFLIINKSTNQDRLRFRVILWSVPRSGTIPQFTERLRLLSKLQYCKLQQYYLILIYNISKLQYPLLQYIVTQSRLCRAYHVRIENKVQMWLYCCTNATVQALLMVANFYFLFLSKFCIGTKVIDTEA